jgi:hypothetical protein
MVQRPAATRVRSNSLQKKYEMPETMLWETCAVELRVQLPRDLAAEVEEVQKRDPEGLSRILLYAMTRRMIFEHLVRSGEAGTG